MKTLTFKYLKLFLLAVAMINLTSCEIEIDDFYDDDNIGGSYYNKSLDLCSRPWADTFYDADGNYCYQELNFYLDRHGEDYIRVEYPNGRYSESVYSFTWNWEDRSQYSFGWYMVPVMSLISTMSGFGECAERIPGWTR